MTPRPPIAAGDEAALLRTLLAEHGQILLAGQLDADAVELSISECDPAEVAAEITAMTSSWPAKLISMSSWMMARSVQ